MHMNSINPNKYCELTRDSKREQETLKTLREMEEYSKFEFIWNVLKKRPGLGFPLVKGAQLKRAHLEVILEYGLVYGDASTVRWWYEATVEGLGERRVVDIISSHLENGPLIVEKVLYWLRPENESAKKAVGKLQKDFKERYPKFKSTRSTGIHATNA